MATLRLLRNNEMFVNQAAAMESINEMKGHLSDGEIWLASYGVAPEVKTILAIKRDGGVTIIDSSAIGGDIAQQIQDAIDRLANIAKTGLASDATATPITETSTSVAVEGTNIADQIASLATTLKTVESNASKYKLVKLTSEEVIALQDENVKEAYKVVSFIGEDTAQTVYTQVGDTVKIYKDSALKEVYLGANTDTIDATTGEITKNTVTDPQSMNFAYQLANGSYSLTKIDVSKFLTQSEFGNGFEINGAGVVSVKADTTSSDAERFISIGSNGVKISGVQDAIDNATSTMTEEINTRLDEVERVISESLNDLEMRKAEKTELQQLSLNALNEVQAGLGINVSEKIGNKQTISIKLGEPNGEALKLTENGLILDIIDCDTY